MTSTIVPLSEVVVLIFNILIFSKLIVPKKNNPLYYTLMYGGSAFILTIFFLHICFGIFVGEVGSFVYVTVPTVILFYILSKYKDCRFWVTVCLLNTITSAIVAISRCVGIIGGEIPSIISSVFACVIIVVIYFKGNSYFERYHELMSAIESGWGIMALSMAMVYASIVLSVSYPVPLSERPEDIYMFIYTVFTMLSFHAVFFLNLSQKKHLLTLNEQLSEEKKWHKTAYFDSLTKVKNRMAYIENVSNMERNLPKHSKISIIMIDVDNFKNVNDTLGHKAGDGVLKDIVNMLKNIFNDNSYTIYRVGGDEFVVIALDIAFEILESIVANINTTKEFAEIGCSISCGFLDVDLYEDNAFERALSRADKKMYQMKMKHKKAYVKARV